MPYKHRCLHTAGAAAWLHHKHGCIPTTAAAAAAAADAPDEGQQLGAEGAACDLRELHLPPVSGHQAAQGVDLAVGVARAGVLCAGLVRVPHALVCQEGVVRQDLPRRPLCFVAADDARLLAGGLRRLLCIQQDSM